MALNRLKSKVAIKPHLLLVEDNPGDVLLMQEVFSQSASSVALQIAYDGDAALKMLRREDGFEKLPKIDIVLLDLNLPGRNGYEVLKEIKCDQRTKKIPVIVLSSSNAEADINKVYGLHGNSYIVKPVSLGQYQQAIASIEEFWFEVAQLTS